MVVYPTDTVYGLGCDPFKEDAVEKLHKVKERKARALPVLVDSFDTAWRMGSFDRVARSLAKRFWPGPLTIVVPAIATFPTMVTGRTFTVGLRIPRRDETIQLIRLSGGSLIGTSANMAGNPSSRTAIEALKELNGRVDIILDGGPSTLGTESTVVKVESGEVEFLRATTRAREKVLASLDSP